jgi:hypothetical protein
MNGAMRLLRSSRTAIVLLLAFSTWSAVLTARGVGEAWNYVGALLGVLLAANIAACTWSRLKHKPLLDLRHASDLALHLALVAVVAGMLLKSATAVTTLSYLFLGETVDTFNTEDERPVPLGFGVLVREIRESYYPVRLMVRMNREGAPTVGEEKELVEGRPLTTGGGLRLETALDGEKLMLLVDGYPHEVTRDTPVEQGGWRIFPLAYRRDLKNTVAEVDVIEDGRVVRQGRVALNERFVHRGKRLTFTGRGRDEKGNDFVSMQAVYEPFEPLFWLGAILFSAACPVLLLVKGRSLPPR